jgi:4-diphosphocytidyl-2-C-methyl-D-erythritol kinase
LTGAAAKIEAQAKINLHLRVFDREFSGYHAIETIFCRIDLSDWLTVRITEGRQSLDVVPAIPGDVVDLGPAEANLAYRAATAYAAVAGWPPGVEIRLTKWIDAGAGLGGGSADAAAVLRLLNFLAPSPLSQDQLHSIAITLGSDVPFLLSSEVVALGTGRGDEITPLPALERKQVLLIIPDFSVSTKDAYSWLDDDRAAGLTSKLDVPRLANVDELHSWTRITSLARNDFVDPIARRYPVITEILDALRKAGASFAGMTGSGSALFGLFETVPNLTDLVAFRSGAIRVTQTAISVVHPVRVE